MFGKRKSKKSDPVDPLKLEAPVDTRPLSAADSLPPGPGHRFSFDIDGPVPHPRGLIDDADEEPRRRHGAPGLRYDVD